MKNDYLEEDRQIIDTISRNFFTEVLIIIIYVSIFLKMNGKFTNEQKFFMHLTNDQTFISKLLFVFWIAALCVISLLTALYLAKRFFLKKYWRIKSNLFFLNNEWIISLNCILKICSYTMLTISFMSLQRLLLTLSFVSLLSWLEEKKNREFKLSPEIFSWGDTNLSKLFIYSLIAAISFPAYGVALRSKFTQKLKASSSQLINKTKEDLPPEIYKFASDIFSNVPFSSLLLSARKILEEILNSKKTKGGIFIIILVGFLRETISQSISSFKSFWKEVKSTERRVEWFKLFSNFQLAAENKKIRGFGQGINGFPTLCYESFTLNPNFIKQNYTENRNGFNKEFTEKVGNVNQFIKTINSEVNEPKERIFIFYWLFNHINSFQDFFLYDRLVNGASRFYSKSVSTNT